MKNDETPNQLPLDYFINRRASYHQNLSLLRIEEIRVLESSIDQVDFWSDSKAFQHLIGFAIELGITQTTISNLLNINTGTISRWASGHSRPAKYVRPIVIEKMSALLSEQKQALAA